MTTKQYSFLLKFIPADLLDKSEFNDSNFTNSCIDFIVKTNNYGSPIFDIIVKKEVLTEEELDLVRHLKEHINSDTEKYIGPNDESYSFEYAYYIPESDNLFFIFRQNWFKGMSTTSTSNYIHVDRTGKELFYNIQYTELFRMNINRLNKFFEYLKRNSFTPQI